MSRKKSFQASQKSDEINISPLIDMVFILLIFFIVTTVFVDERGIEASKPSDANPPEDEQTEPIIFKISKSGEVFYGSGAENVGISGVNRVVRNNMGEDNLPVIIQVEQGSRAEIALRVFDEALNAGATAVNLKEAK